LLWCSWIHHAPKKFRVAHSQIRDEFRDKPIHFRVLIRLWLWSTAAVVHGQPARTGH
jgi:hypothetical protein